MTWPKRIEEEMGDTIYIVEIPKNFRVDLNYFSKRPDVLTYIRTHLEPNVGSDDTGDFFDDDGGFVSRVREAAFNTGFISKTVCDELNKGIDEIRKGEVLRDDDDRYIPLIDLFKRKKIIALVLEDMANSSYIVQLSAAEKKKLIKKLEG